MTTKVLPAGTRFADWSSARGVFDPLEALGIYTGSRYLSPSFQAQVTTGKCFSIPERDEGWARGWSWLMNWENSATDALGGAPAGTKMGKQCYDQLRTIEYDVNPLLRISVSCDTDARNSLQIVGDYFHAFSDQLHEYQPQMDAYGGSYECNWLAWCGPHWLTTSRGWSDPAVWAAINRGDWSNPLLDNLYGFQTAVGSTSRWDIDVLLKPVTVWTGVGADHPPVIVTPTPPAPIPEPVHGPFPRQLVRKGDYDMKYILQAPGRPSTVLINGVAIPAGSPDDLAGFATGTYESINTTPAMFDKTIAAYAAPATPA